MAGNRRSGRKFVPTAIKRRSGSQVRHDAAHEPSAPAGRPAMPAHVSGDPIAADAYGVIADRLLAQQVLTTAHGELLALLADGWATYIRMRQAFAAQDYAPVITQEWTDGEGKHRSRKIENPLCRLLRQQALLLNTLFGEFGQTPASAPKVAAPSSSDPFEAFLDSPAAVLPFTAARRRRSR